jgi:phospholipid/cholesterol/gamma-HCH transport system permease protein
MAEPTESAAAASGPRGRRPRSPRPAAVDQSSPQAFLRARRDAEQLTLELSGPWRALHFDQIQSELAALSLDGVRQVQIDTRTAELDLEGAWLLRELERRADSAGAEVGFTGGTPPVLALLSRCVAGDLPSATREVTALAPTSAVEEAVEDLGRRTVRGVQDALAALRFVGEVSVALGRGLRQPRRLRPISMYRHIYDSGMTAVPIVALIAFLVAVILAYLGEQELRQFGATIFVVDLVTVGVLRELGGLLTAIILAGRSGSAFAAEIGAMQLNQEVDALRSMGVDPIEVLVVPRVLGLVIALPLLTLVADLIGLAGGGVLCHLLLQMPTAQYLHRVQGAIASTTFWVGIIKAPMFALLIAMAGCFNGMRVRMSSREVGRLTTVAVVQAIFCVILADALFAVLFLRLDI